MATKEELVRIVGRSLPIRGFFDEGSSASKVALNRATDILIGVSEELVGESAKVQAGLRDINLAEETFRQKYFVALAETRTWKDSCQPRTEGYKVADALLEHLIATGERYGLR